MSEGMFRLALHRNQMTAARLASYGERFEQRGIEYTRGFLASDQGRAPKFYLKLKRQVRVFFGFGLMFESAHLVLADAGLDPFACGRELYD